MRTTRSALIAAVAVLAGLSATVTGCSSGDGSAEPAAASSGPPSGPACARLPAEGPGSPAALATGPLGGALATSPLLTTLAAAVQDANLVDVLNSASGVTLLAPDDAAFDAVPPETLGPLLADTPALTRLLGHHVLRGRLSPAQLTGVHTTLAGDRVTVTGSGERFTVSADQTLPGTAAATVVCGALQTASATVYVVDQVLEPAG